MPSEAAVQREATPVERALLATRDGSERFRSAVSAAKDEVRGEMLRRGDAGTSAAERARRELGLFGHGRIDPARFALLLEVAEAGLSPESIDVLARADQILAGFVQTSRHLVEVGPGGDLRDVVKDALSDLGRAFGAARAVELARAGTFDPLEHGHLLGPLPFRLWNRAERHLAPPLVVSMRGEDCLPAGLGEFLDGEVKVVLVPSGPAAPAPLARLITPGTFVMQTEDPADLGRLVESRHPGVALLFDAERPGQACFVHDPDRGGAPWDRIEVRRMPAQDDVGRGRRAPAWLEELTHLRALAERPAAARDGVAAPADVEADEVLAGRAAAATAQPADRIAAWLWASTDLSGA